MSRHTQLRGLGWTMLIVSSKCLTPIGTRGFLRPSQMPMFANVIVSVNLSPSMPECQGFLQFLDEGYSGAMTSWSSPGEQQAQSGAGRQKGWPQQGGSKENNETQLLSTRLTTTWKMALRGWRRVWEDSAIDQNKIKKMEKWGKCFHWRTNTKRKTKDYLAPWWINNGESK